VKGLKILIVGEGGREHALAIMISRSVQSPKLYAVGSYVNPGIKRIAEATGGKFYTCKTTDPIGITNIAEEISPDIIVIGPEEPQFAGVVDVLKEKGFSVFGASKRLADIERDRVFARTLMWKYEIPGRLFFKAFKNLEEASKFAEMAGDTVIKPARQAGGKGVKVVADQEAYLTKDRSIVKKVYVEKLFKDISRKYHDIDHKIVIEQRVEGVEYTLMVITDGTTVIPLPIVQDHPHAFEYDLGPETGGMGCIAGPGELLPFIEMDEYKRSIEIVRKTIYALQKESKEHYRGAIAGQMMLTAYWGPTVIEYYSRFGDPEISALVPILESDFVEVLEKTVDGRLACTKIEINKDSAVVVKALIPAGYPHDRSIARNHPISIDESEISKHGCIVLYAGTRLDPDGILRTTGSRAVEIICTGEKHSEASKKANIALEKAVQSLDGWPLYFRKDIGSEELLVQRMELASIVREVYGYRERRGLLGASIVWIPKKGIFIDPLQNPIIMR